MANLLDSQADPSRSSIDPPPLLYSQPPFSRRIVYFLKLWGLKILSSIGFMVLRFLKSTPQELQPTIVKAYSCRPQLRNRIFIPRSHKTGERLPLYLDLHGGGFTFCDAEFDDEFCASLANKFKVLVVSIEYSTAPLNKFPVPPNDVAAISLAVIEDKTLPIDKSRVVLGGFSAGGNLCLSATQLPALKDKIKGVVSWYPVTDLSLTPSEKQHSRFYRNAKDLDDLKDWGPIWDLSYIPPGSNIRDPLLSVRYVKRENVPKWIYIIGAEYDMLMKEARDTIFDLADLSDQERNEGLREFEKGSYKWTLMADVRHGFTHDLMEMKGADVEDIRKRRYATALEKVGSWLFQGPFAVRI